MKARILCGVIGILIVLSSGVVLAQSAKQAADSAKEAKTILDNAKSKDDYHLAAQKYEEALKIWEKVKLDKEIGICSHQLGFIQSTLGQYQKALEHYEKSLALQKKIGVPYDCTEDSSGNVYLTIGDIQRAEPILKKANRGVSLGRLALVKSDFSEAKIKFQSQLNRSLKNRSVLMGCLLPIQDRGCPMKV